MDVMDGVDAMDVPLVIVGDDAVPAYEQLRSQLAGAIYAGTFASGERLPTARDLAGRLAIAVNTVTRAYGELSRAGLIDSRRRFGTTVTGGENVPDSVLAAARRLAMRARSAGLSPRQAADLLGAVAHDATRSE